MYGGEKFPDERTFSWSNRSGSRQSRIDFWLLSNFVEKDKITVNFLATPLTDHRAIHINIQFSTTDDAPHRSSYWKLNNSLLEHDTVKTKIRKLISHFWNKAESENLYSTNWELFKFESGKFLRQYGSSISKSKIAVKIQKYHLQL